MTQTPSVARSVDFWFDFSCPYAYLGSTQLSRVEAATGARIRLQPFLLGGVFRVLRQPQNMSVTLNEPKKQHNRADLMRWATWFEAPLRTPFQHPNRTVMALRTLLACPPERWRDVVDAFFAMYWVHARDISDPDQVAATLTALGLDGPQLVARSQDSDLKAELFRRTDAAIAAGVFGAPAWIVGDQLFWGQDRVEMVIRAARDGWRSDPALSTFQFNQETTPDE